MDDKMEHGFAQYSRFVATAGRGTESFAADEIRSLGGTHVEWIQGKIFFTAPHVGILSQLHMIERVFVLVAHRPSPSLPRYIPLALAQLSRVVQALPWWQAAHTCWLRVQESTDSMCMGTKRPADAAVAEPPPSQDRRSQDGLSVPRFRISCKCSIRALTSATTDEISHALSIALAAATGWHPSPRDYNLEVYMHLSEAAVVIGLSLFRRPVSERVFLAHSGLRWPVCVLLTRLATATLDHTTRPPLDQHPPEALLADADAAGHESLPAPAPVPASAGHSPLMILDPMCGRGTIAVAAAQLLPGAVVIAADRSGEAIADCCANIKYLHEYTTRAAAETLLESDKKLDKVSDGATADGSLRTSRLAPTHSQHSAPHVILPLVADCRALPFRAMLFDAVISDLPFGQTHTVAGSLSRFYLHALEEMARVTKPAGRAVLLVNQPGLILSALWPHWTRIASHAVGLGKTQGHVIVLLRTLAPHTPTLTGGVWEREEEEREEIPSSERQKGIKREWERESNVTVAGVEGQQQEEDHKAGARGARPQGLDRGSGVLGGARRRGRGRWG
eukprot:m.38868 g.38868  ORF g.38868 m.38868 type:complete len:562 (+) comp10047_c0_seq3:114-1799(+)